MLSKHTFPYHSHLDFRLVPKDVPPAPIASVLGKDGEREAVEEEEDTL